MSERRSTWPAVAAARRHRLLGRHVLRRPHRHPGVGEAPRTAIDAAGDAEVEHLDEVGLAVARDQVDVLGLEVAVDHARRVRRVQRAADLHADAHRAQRIDAPLVRQHVGEVDAVEVLHHEVGAAVLGRAEVGDVDDVGVADARGGARLAPEALDQVLLLRVDRVQDLDRDALADLDVLAGVDRAHAALADLAQDAVAVLDHPSDEIAAGVERIGRRRQRRQREHLLPGLEQPLALVALFTDEAAVKAAQELGRALGVGVRRDADDHLGQRLAHLLGGLKALRALGGQRLQHQRVELGGDPGRLARRRLGLGVAHQRQRRRRVEVAELHVLLAGQQLPQHDAQAVDVAAPVGDLAARLLGGQVRRAPEDDARVGVLLLEHAAREAEVGELGLAEVAEQDVGRRHVAMDEVQIAVRVHVRQRARDLAHHVQRDLERDACASAHTAIPDLAQVLPFDQLHRDEELAVDVAGVEGDHQVAVRELEHDLGLVEKPVRLALVGLLRQDLLDDAELFEAVDLAADRDIDLSHAPARKRFEEDVFPESLWIAIEHQHRLKQRTMSWSKRESLTGAPPG